MDRLREAWRAIWQDDVTGDAAVLLTATAVFIPFGWVLVLARSRPVRTAFRSLRDRGSVVGGKVNHDLVARAPAPAP